jgi:hypothetical protein
VAWLPRHRSLISAQAAPVGDSPTTPLVGTASVPTTTSRSATKKMHQIVEARRDDWTARAAQSAAALRKRRHRFREKAKLREPAHPNSDPWELASDVSNIFGSRDALLLERLSERDSTIAPPMVEAPTMSKTRTSVTGRRLPLAPPCRERAAKVIVVVHEVADSMRRAKSRRTIKPRFGASASSEDLLSLRYCSKNALAVSTGIPAPSA